MGQLGVFRDDFYNATSVLPQNQLSSRTDLTGVVLPASAMAGGQEVFIIESGSATAIALTTDTAANIVARMQNAITAQANALGIINNIGSPPAGVPNLFNTGYFLQIINNNTASGAITLSAGAGVTLVAGTPIAIATNVSFVVVVTGPTAVTITRVGSGTN